MLHHRWWHGMQSAQYAHWSVCQRHCTPSCAAHVARSSADSSWVDAVEQRRQLGGAMIRVLSAVPVAAVLVSALAQVLEEVKWLLHEP